MKKSKVNGESGMIRDSVSRAILFTDKQEVLNYKNKKKSMKLQNEEINTLKQELSELRELVKQLIDRQER